MSLLQRAEKWTQEWKAEGEVKGRRLGKAEALKDLASHRFGELTAQTIAQIDRADVDTLDRWFHRCLSAASLDDVLTE